MDFELTDHHYIFEERKIRKKYEKKFGRIKRRYSKLTKEEIIKNFLDNIEFWQKEFDDYFLKRKESLYNLAGFLICKNSLIKIQEEYLNFLS